MTQIEESCDVDACRGLVRRVVASSLISRSARLREMLLYLSAKVLDEQVSNVHEMELGHSVFGRPEHYDTATDNIVRVHASLLRKRLAEYFRTEGADEELTIEIPRGNYAPVFKPRRSTAETGPVAVGPDPPHIPESARAESESFSRFPVSFGENATLERRKPRYWIAGITVVLLVAVGCGLVYKLRESSHTVSGNTSLKLPRLWGDLFPAGGSTAIVLDDAALDLYQKATGHPVALSEYYDRSYLTSVEQSAVNAHLDPDFVRSFLLRRQSSFAGANLAGRLSAIAQQMGNTANVQFAREFSFHELKAGNVILLGSAGSNPWIQPFDSAMTLRWQYDPQQNSYHPVDTEPSGQSVIQYKPGAPKPRDQESYATVAFLPNLSGTGSVLILSGTGGTASAAALSFITDPASEAMIESKLPNEQAPRYFEALLRIDKGAGSRNAQLLLVRTPRRPG